MIEIKIIYKKDIPELLSNKSFWSHSFLSISKHRLYAHLNNPHLENNDIVLLLSYLNEELVGYMGVLTDQITLDGQLKKIGWLSTWWVHPKTKGSGIGREILNTMHAKLDGQIGISQFTPSAKRVYDKSGYFTTLKEQIGLKAVLRSNFSFVIPALYPKTEKFGFLFNQVDYFINFFVNIKLAVQKIGIESNLKKFRVEYLNTIDNETLKFINQFNKTDLSNKGASFFEWLKAYQWVQEAPLLQWTDKSKYAFSMYDKEFGFSFIKVYKEQTVIGFVVLQKRNYVSKVLFTYYDDFKYAAEIANIIKLQAIIQNTREIICYDEAICKQFKKNSIFLYQTKKIKQSIISKAFNKTNFDDIRMHFGDGDCSFA
ncbi:GNAT family N-acetyltransferase [Flavobacterium sp. SM2513]|uniref:GNAT family N-acetyltransferase n=1 Tax=Flavobacterium sp. SM2513 TaxID=3424766 RepID=UPI003D7F5AB8